MTYILVGPRQHSTLVSNSHISTIFWLNCFQIPTIDNRRQNFDEIWQNFDEHRRSKRPPSCFEALDFSNRLLSVVDRPRARVQHQRKVSSFTARYRAQSHFGAQCHHQPSAKRVPEIFWRNSWRNRTTGLCRSKSRSLFVGRRKWFRSQKWPGTSASFKNILCKYSGGLNTEHVRILHGP